MNAPETLFDLLNRGGVDYIVIGGLAAMLHGSSRVTKDIDIAYNGALYNRQRLCAVVNELSPQLVNASAPKGRAIALTPQILKAHPRLQLATRLGLIDLLSDVDGFSTYAQMKHASVLEDVDGRLVRFLSREGLLKSKRATNRPKDIEDVKQIEALREVELLDDRNRE